MADSNQSFNRRTVLKSVGGAFVGTSGIASATNTVSADSGFSPNDLATSDSFTFWVVRENGAEYQSKWDSHIDNWANGLENFLENHIGVPANIGVRNEYSTTTINWDDPSDWPSWLAPDSNTFPCIIVEDTRKMLGKSHESSIYVNQNPGHKDMTYTPQDYVEPMLMHEVLHILCPNNDGAVEHGFGDINADYDPQAGQYYFYPTAMATGYVLCELFSNNPPKERPARTMIGNKHVTHLQYIRNKK